MRHPLFKIYDSFSMYFKNLFSVNLIPIMFIEIGKYMCLRKVILANNKLLFTSWKQFQFHIILMIRMIMKIEVILKTTWDWFFEKNNFCKFFMHNVHNTTHQTIIRSTSTMKKLEKVWNMSIVNNKDIVLVSLLLSWKIFYIFF